MKTLVVGGAGYVGSVVTRLLLQDGHEVVVLDDCSTGHADSVPEGVRFIQADVTTASGVLAGGGFDAVLHFAAKSQVGESVLKPSIYWHTNVLGSRALLDAITEHRIPGWCSPPPPPCTANRRSSRSPRTRRPSRPAPTARRSWRWT